MTIFDWLFKAKKDYIEVKNEEEIAIRRFCNIFGFNTSDTLIFTLNTACEKYEELMQKYKEVISDETKDDHAGWP